MFNGYKKNNIFAAINHIETKLYNIPGLLNITYSKYISDIRIKKMKNFIEELKRENQNYKKK